MSDRPSEHPLAAFFPPARVRIVTPRLELRLPTDAEIDQIADVAIEGVHAPEEMPFSAPWSDAPPDELGRSAVQWHAHQRANWKPDRWTFLFSVFEDGMPIGAQDAGASEFSVVREVTSASWLGKRYHGSGLGTEMRQAVLHFAFEGLGALSACSGAYEDNRASQRVSEKCGYQPDGINRVVLSRGERAPGGVAEMAATELRFRITREQWLPRRRDDIEIHGLDDEVRAFLGIG